MELWPIGFVLTAQRKKIGNSGHQRTGRWLNNRAENSHLPFGRRERAMQCFLQMRSSQKFASVHASIRNHFNLDRNLCSRAKPQGQPRRRSFGTAPTWRDISDRATVLAETGSNTSERTHQGHRGLMGAFRDLLRRSQDQVTLRHQDFTRDIDGSCSGLI